MSLSQTLLVVTIAISMIGSLIALTPPNHSARTTARPIPSTGDSIRGFGLTDRHSTKFAMAPLLAGALYICMLAYSAESNGKLASLVSLPQQCVENGMNLDLVTWSPSTAIPLVLIIFVGIPLRLVSYASLGTNFTFALTQPDTLSTTGIYRYVQHPSYTGLVVLLMSLAALLCRVDGVLACCWVPSAWYPTVSALTRWLGVPLGLAILFAAVWTRVKQEERMLRDHFGKEWETWHASTNRFFPLGLPASRREKAP